CHFPDFKTFQTKHMEIAGDKEGLRSIDFCSTTQNPFTEKSSGESDGLKLPRCMTMLTTISIQFPHAHQSSCHTPRIRFPGWRHHGLNHRPAKPHHLLQPQLCGSERLRPRRTDGGASQYRASPRY